MCFFDRIPKLLLIEGSFLKQILEYKNKTQVILSEFKN
jgi:hypothetical protein